MERGRAMPIYASECKDCHEDFQTLVRSGEQPACPSCGKHNLERLLSLIAAPAKGGPADVAPCGREMPAGASCGACMPNMAGCG